MHVNQSHAAQGLDDVLREQPDKKDMIMHNLKESLLPLIDKWVCLQNDGVKSSAFFSKISCCLPNYFFLTFPVLVNIRIYLYWQSRLFGVLSEQTGQPKTYCKANENGSLWPCDDEGWADFLSPYCIIDYQKQTPFFEFTGLKHKLM